MSWIPSSLVSGMQSLFTGHSGAVASRKQTALEDIREAMLDGLGVSSAVAVSKLEQKVTCASDLNDLWYLRGDVMAAIAAVDGEAIARSKLDQISAMFRGLLPKAQTSRSRNLGN